MHLSYQESWGIKRRSEGIDLVLSRNNGRAETTTGDFPKKIVHVVVAAAELRTTKFL